MKKRLLFFFSYALFWIIYFIISKLLFLAYNLESAGEYLFSDWILIFYYGSRLDISTTAYLLLIPGILIALTAFFNTKFLYWFINTYTIIFLVIFSILTVIDMKLYQHWGYRLNTSVMTYLQTPEVIFNSVSTFMIVALIAYMITIASLSIFLYCKTTGKILQNARKSGWKTSLLFIVLTAALFIPIRGGFAQMPINIGRVFFHKEIFPNHAAINLYWNIGFSLSEMDVQQRKIKYMKNEKADRIFSQLFPKTGTGKKVVKQDKPNVIIIMLESFTGEAIEAISGRKGVTPNFGKLIHDGIFFKNFYANGSRSDKALVAILSGYPVLPSTTVIMYPEKTQKLPYISKDLKKKGYSTAYYYGGDINFANMQSYLIIGKFDQIINKSDFPSTNYNAKWGVHDHIMFERFYNDIEKSEAPFFKVFFTLSSHEPFDVPMETVIEGDDLDSKYLNSLYYTDKCLGNFITKAKKTEWWDNTLIILLADHGTRMPGNIPNHKTKKHHIPMLWLGGALSENDTIINIYGQQTDLSKTLLDQLNISSEKYRFGKNLFNDSIANFAFYTYDNGFTYLSENIKVIYDIDSKRLLENSGTKTEKETNYAKAIIQTVSEDFLSK